MTYLPATLHSRVIVIRQAIREADGAEGETPERRGKGPEE
jgi:hypothetical protein